MVYHFLKEKIMKKLWKKFEEKYEATKIDKFTFYLGVASGGLICLLIKIFILK